MGDQITILDFSMLNKTYCMYLKEEQHYKFKTKKRQEYFNYTILATYFKS